MKDLMVKAGGSIQTIVDIPEDIKKLYKLCGKLAKRMSFDMAADGVGSLTNPIYESFHGKSHNVQTLLNAYVCLEARSQDWYVLSEI